MKVRLIHPKLGVCQEVETDYYKTAEKLRHDWSKRYGKKFEECEVKITDMPNNGLLKRIMYIPTGKLYTSVPLASKLTGYSTTKIYLDIENNYKREMTIKFKETYIDANTKKIVEISA